MAKNTFFCEIYFTGNLNEEQKKRLLTIADSCPLHRMLSHPSDIVTTILS
jgi:putative redox protein